MKIKTLKKFKTKLLTFKLLKTRLYKYNNDLNYSRVKDTEIRLKQIFHILYKFHVTNKKILFLGNSNNINNPIKQFLQTKQHIFLPESVWMNGIFTNPKTSFKHLKQQYALTNSKSLKLLLSLRTQIDLVVNLNEQHNIKSLNESSLKRIPIISLNSIYSIFNLNLSAYKIPDDPNVVEKPSQENFFFLLLHSLLKRAEILRKKRIQFKLKQEKIKRQKRLEKQKELRRIKKFKHKTKNRKNAFTQKK